MRRGGSRLRLSSFVFVQFLSQVEGIFVVLFFIFVLCRVVGSGQMRNDSG